MIYIILSSRSIRHSSVSLSLLFILSSLFFTSVTEFFIYDWAFFIFSSSLLKISLCSSIIYPNSVNILITNALNSVPLQMVYFCFIIYFFRGFLLLFKLRAVPLPFHFV